MRTAIRERRPIGDRPASWTGRVAAFGVLALLLMCAPASADVGQTIIERCTHGESVSGFSQQDYRRALQELPTEVEEYSDCGSLIRNAQLAAATGGRGAPAGGFAAAATPLTAAEQSELRRVPRAGAPPIVLGGTLVQPGVVHADVASALSSLPDALLAMLAFLLAWGLIYLAGAVRDRVRARSPR